MKTELPPFNVLPAGRTDELFGGSADRPDRDLALVIEVLSQAATFMDGLRFGALGEGVAGLYLEDACDAVNLALFDLRRCADPAPIAEGPFVVPLGPAGARVDPGR